MKKEDRSNSVFRRELCQLMIPIVLQSLLLNAVSLGDTLMLGLVNQNSLSAVSLASQVFFVMTLFIGTLTTGATVLSSQYMGKGDIPTVERVLGLILRYAALVSVAFFALAFIAPTALMKCFTTDPSLIEIGAEYLRINSFSFLFAGVSQCYLTILKVNDRAKIGTYITTAVVFLDLLLNAVFIFGLFGLPAMGARGAALTTVISKAVELLAILIYACKGDMIRARMNAVFGFRAPVEKEFWTFTLPVFLNSLAWGGSITVYSVIMGHLGSDATAAYSVVTIVKNTVVCFSMGLGSATGILLGKLLGDDRLDEAKNYGACLSRMSVLMGVIAAILSIPFGFAIRLLFKTTDTANANILTMLFFCAVTCFGRCVNDTVICGVFAAGGDTKFDAVSLITVVWGIVIPVALCAAFWWRLPVVWVYFVLCMDEIIKLPWVFAHYKKYLWVRNITKDGL